jgi:uncharacterized protein
MSQENVEIVRRMYDAWNQRDLESALALTDPEFEYINPPTAVEPGTRHGHDGLAEVARAQWEFFADSELEIQRIHDRGEEVLAHLGVARRMPGSDHSIETQSLASWTIRDGKVIRAEILAVGPPDVREALEAAGLREL